MPEQSIPMSRDFQGQTLPGLADPRHFQEPWQRGSSLAEVNGNGAAAGTLIATITIPNQRTLTVWGVILNALNGAKTFLLVESTLATVGGVEIIHHIADFAAAGAWHIAPPVGPLCVITNTTGGNRFFNIYIPLNRLGAAGNNVAGQYTSASISATLD